ncbi:unnamed protein product [Prorocentrum cordatum]|uniref:Uncharacterized protein n=1 Tax=Prorocentrum cordatum TaxID=2364126 RepID=A0ABN9PDK4_9DINO|nr:unnamed protein product [Polarella glacialis]
MKGAGPEAHGGPGAPSHQDQLFVLRRFLAVVGPVEGPRKSRERRTTSGLLALGSPAPPWRGWPGGGARERPALQKPRARRGPPREADVAGAANTEEEEEEEEMHTSERCQDTLLPGRGGFPANGLCWQRIRIQSSQASPEQILALTRVRASPVGEARAPGQNTSLVRCDSSRLRTEA